MKLLKVEKDFCPACNQLQAVLEDAGVEYTSINIQSSDEKEAEKAREILGELQLFTVPVTVLVDDEDNVVDHAKGVDREKLQELFAQL